MQKQRIVLVLCSHIPDNNKAMSQSMVQKILNNHVMTSYINVNNCCNETKHVKPTKSLYRRQIIKHNFEVKGNTAFPVVFKHPVMNETLFDCLPHAVPQSRNCSSYITSLATLKMLRKLNCIATRISKVESRWVGRSPNSRCFIPSRPKNSSREDGEPETTLRLARFHRFLDEPRPTHVREMTSSAQRGETVRAVTLRTVHLALGLKP